VRLCEGARACPESVRESLLPGVCEGGARASLLPVRTHSVGLCGRRVSKGVCEGLWQSVRAAFESELERVCSRECARVFLTVCE
jgi:hypothetical protein